MTTSFQLPTRLAEKLQASAADNGLDINQYVIQLLEEKMTSTAEPANREKELLTKITTGLSVDNG